MSFVIDTDICSAHLRGDAKTFNKFLQHSGGLFVSTITVSELFAWVHRRKTKPHYLQGLNDLLRELQIISFDYTLAEYAGTLRADLLDQGLVVPQSDLLIGASALYHNFTMVTQNVKHFSLIPNLRIQDWRD